MVVLHYKKMISYVTIIRLKVILHCLFITILTGICQITQHDLTGSICGFLVGKKSPWPQDKENLRWAPIERLPTFVPNSRRVFCYEKLFWSFVLLITIPSSDFLGTSYRSKKVLFLHGTKAAVARLFGELVVFVLCLSSLILKCFETSRVLYRFEVL